MPSARIGMVASPISRSFHGPAGVAVHDLVERNTFLLSSDPDVPRDFRNGKHNPGLTHKKFLGRGVVHDAGAPGDRMALEIETATEEDPGIPDPELGKQLELFLAGLILRVGREILQKAASRADREEISVVMVPFDQIALGRWDFVVAGLSSLSSVCGGFCVWVAGGVAGCDPPDWVAGACWATAARGAAMRTTSTGNETTRAARFNMALPFARSASIGAEQGLQILRGSGEGSAAPATAVSAPSAGSVRPTR